MSAGNYNIHWDQLAAAGQTQNLVQELELWRNSFQASLRAWMEQASREWGESAQPLLDDLAKLDPASMVQNWPEWREHLSALNQDGHLLREEYLQQLGPTPLGCLNSILLQLQRLEQFPEAISAVGSALFADLKTFESWAAENSIHGPAYEKLRIWLEDLGLGLLARKYPTPAQGQAELVRLWEGLGEEHARQASERALEGPTRSRRWNSWILLLELCEHEIQDHGPVLDTLDALDADVEDVGQRLGEQNDVAEIVAEYHEASQQLRQALLQGKRLKGWSQVIPPLLVELDQLVPQESMDQQPVSRVRRLCQDFEAGKLSTEQFHSGLDELAGSLTEGRKQSRVQTAQHPSEAAFVEALGKLQGGLDILTSVERAGQASRLEMGCTLIEEGLAQLEKLEGG